MTRTNIDRTHAHAARAKEDIRSRICASTCLVQIAHIIAPVFSSFPSFFYIYSHFSLLLLSGRCLLCFLRLFLLLFCLVFASAYLCCGKWAKAIYVSAHNVFKMHTGCIQFVSIISNDNFAQFIFCTDAAATGTCKQIHKSPYPYIYIAYSRLAHIHHWLNKTSNAVHMNSKLFVLNCKLFVLVCVSVL